MENTKVDRLKLGIQTYGMHGTFYQQYLALRANLSSEEALDKFFDGWLVPKTYESGNVISWSATVGESKVCVLIYVGEDDPVQHLDNVVKLYTKGTEYREFIDSSHDNPWTRILLFDDGQPARPEPAKISGYHTRPIRKGVYGEFSKIQEEFAELADAVEQNDQILALVELTDLIGACAGYAAKHNISLDSLVQFAKLTSKAFADGTRSAKS